MRVRSELWSAAVMARAAVRLSLVVGRVCRGQRHEGAECIGSTGDAGGLVEFWSDALVIWEWPSDDVANMTLSSPRERRVRAD